MTIKVKNIDTSTIDGKIAVMQAYKNGDKIAMRAKYNGPNRWVSANKPAWSWYDYDYAVIEKPLEMWAVVGEVGGRPISITLADSKATAESWAHSWNNPINRAYYRAVKLHEVQE